jgi:hypothetical protein
MKGVYIIQAGTEGPIKIGYSRDVKKRLRILQTGHYERLHFVFVWENATPAEECYLHEGLSPWRLEGEWFAFDAQISVHMCRMIDQRGLPRSRWKESGAFEY